MLFGCGEQDYRLGMNKDTSDTSPVRCIQTDADTVITKTRQDARLLTLSQLLPAAKENLDTLYFESVCIVIYHPRCSGMKMQEGVNGTLVTGRL